MDNQKIITELPKKAKKKMSKKKKIFIGIGSFFGICLATLLFLLYGPYSGFRNWLITSAMTTMNHQYLATWFYSDETIQKVLSENAVIESGEDTNSNLINIGEIDFDGTYANKYDKEILTKDKEHPDYKIINITGKGYTGFLVAIYDPSRVSVTATQFLGNKGQYLTTMTKNTKAIVAINGGGFYDPGYSGNAGEPNGLTMVNGKVVYELHPGEKNQLIAFNKENKLILARMTKSEAIAAGIRDCVTFNPYLIVNGKASFIKGNGGWGTAPRTAIGQREDGIVLFLVIDGRRLSKPGADMIDLTEIMQNYGAINAANLDGGTSSNLVVNNQLINDPIDSTGAHATRPIATGFIFK